MAIQYYMRIMSAPPCHGHLGLKEKQCQGIKVLPAPIAGWTDFAFRTVLFECGAAEVWTEMISATALVMRSAKTKAMLRRVEVPAGGRLRQVVQLFGNNPAHFAEVVKNGELSGYDEININMGCPAPKIVKNKSGCYLMTDIDKAREIVMACVEARGGAEVSVKMRLGWDKNIAVQFAKMCESCGVDRIIVHGRLGVDGYRGVADWAAIAEVVSAVSIPVIANGDIVDRASAERCLAVTKTDGVMMGRALLGAPWKIRLDDVKPTVDDIHKIIRRHKELFDGNKSDLIKHGLQYAKSLGLKVTPEQLKSLPVLGELF